MKLYSHHAQLIQNLNAVISESRNVKVRPAQSLKLRELVTACVLRYIHPTGFDITRHNVYLMLALYRCDLGERQRVQT